MLFIFMLKCFKKNVFCHTPFALLGSNFHACAHTYVNTHALCGHARVPASKCFNMKNVSNLNVLNDLKRMCFAPPTLICEHIHTHALLHMLTCMYAHAWKCTNAHA